MKRIVYILLALQLVSCNPNVKKFDLITFKKHKQLTEGDTLISFSETDSHYIEEKRAKNDTLVVSRNSYYKSNLNLSSSTYMIYNASAPIHLGVMRHYDVNGNLTSIYDFDRGFKYSVVDLIKMLNSEYNMQIDPKNKTYSIDRDYEKKHYHARFYKVNQYGRRPYQITFDGANGKYIDEGNYLLPCGNNQN